MLRTFFSALSDPHCNPGHTDSQMRKLSRSKNTKSWESQLGAWSGYSPCLLSPSEGLGSWSWREASPGIPQVLDPLNLHPSLSEEPRPVFPLWHGCDLQGLVSHVSPLLILDEDLVQHCCSWGGQGILQLPQEVGVHREQFLPQGKEEGRDGAEAGHRHRVTGEERVAHMPQGRLQPETISWDEAKRSGDLPAHLHVNEDGLHVLRLEESL